MTEQKDAPPESEHAESVPTALRNERRARLAAARRFRIAAEDAEQRATSALSSLGQELRQPLAHALDFLEV